MFGAEYQIDMKNDYMSSVYEHDIPCAVCLVRHRSVAKMFPGKYSVYVKYNVVYTMNKNQTSHRQRIRRC